MGKIVYTNLAILVSILFLGLGCGGNGENGNDGKNGINSLTKTTTIPAGGADCAYGGMKIEIGLDKNGDNKLSSDEVDSTSTQNICTGPSNGELLTRVVNLAVGDSHCKYGGAKIETGADNGASNGIKGNQSLEDSEVDASKTKYICNNAPVVAIIALFSCKDRVFLI